MADNTTPEMKPTLGLTGLTMNAMALIAPGAFLWLTFAFRRPRACTAPSMWIGIVVALLLCLATAVCYAEMAKLYPGTGSSYYFAEQSFLNHEKAWRYARLSKFIVGWGSHLYYWIYPGVMVAVMGVLCGYLVGTLWPNFMSASNPGPAVHDAGRGRVLLRGRLHRPSRRERLHRGQHRDQRDSDLRAAGVLRHGARLPHRIIRREASPSSSIPRPARLTPTSSRPTKTTANGADHRRRSFAMRTAFRSRSWMRPASRCRSTSLIRTKDEKGNFLTHPNAGIGSRHAQFRLGVRAGHSRDSDSGRL